MAKSAYLSEPIKCSKDPDMEAAEYLVQLSEEENNEENDSSISNSNYDSKSKNKNKNENEEEEKDHRQDDSSSSSSNKEEIFVRETAVSQQKKRRLTHDGTRVTRATLQLSSLSLTHDGSDGSSFQLPHDQGSICSMYYATFGIETPPPLAL
ncbi:hypothetical protein NE237_030740 [Protea cynaroides]|uniref:Uncharacterized protein n=1 Tax=Protea cynaroides TaxID=273540 RepID=A0A9Q0GUB1_9MAGN|nr:hypothetical protein NE237_030740 [Protea cynaroides]